jgi:hypothetical protein
MHIGYLPSNIKDSLAETRWIREDKDVSHTSVCAGEGIATYKTDPDITLKKQDCVIL